MLPQMPGNKALVPLTEPEMLGNEALVPFWTKYTETHEILNVDI